MAYRDLSDEERKEMMSAHCKVLTLSMFDETECKRLEMMMADRMTGTPSLFVN